MEYIKFKYEIIVKENIKIEDKKMLEDILRIV